MMWTTAVYRLPPLNVAAAEFHRQLRGSVVRSRRARNRFEAASSVRRATGMNRPYIASITQPTFHLKRSNPKVAWEIFKYGCWA